MIHLTMNEFIYYGLVLTIFALYMSIYIKNRHHIIPNRRNSTRWGIVFSFVIFGIVGALLEQISWLAAVLVAVIAGVAAYYVVFIKYKP